MKEIIDGRWVSSEKFNMIIKLETEDTRLIFGGKESSAM